MKTHIITKIFLSILIISSPLAAQTEDSVRLVIVAPKTIYTQSPASVSITAVTIADQTPAVVSVSLRLKISESNSLELVTGLTDSAGRLTAEFGVPDIEPGSYTLEIKSAGLSEPLLAPIGVRKMPIVLIETDKPIYKPGQVIKGRILILDNILRPITQKGGIEITDGKGVKIFREELETNAFGVAPFELPLATELNYGTWKITAESGSSSAFIDIRVEEYVLPRFEVDLSTEKDYFLVDQEISGTINAAYFFGKPVDGTVQISAEKYVGVWEEYAQFSGTLSEGKIEFSLPATGYVSGTSSGGGSGSVQLHCVVADTSEHEETTTKLLNMTAL